MKKKQRFYVMIESDKEIEPKDIVFALSKARPDWKFTSASLAAQQGSHPTAAGVSQGDDNPESGGG